MSTKLTCDQIEGVVKNFATLALTVSDTGLVAADALNLAERTTGNGGGAMWDVVLSSTVTENTFNIVQGVGVATLSLVLRTEKRPIIIREWGAKGDITTDDTLVIQHVLDSSQSGDIIEFGLGWYKVTSLTLPNHRFHFKGVGYSK